MTISKLCKDCGFYIQSHAVDRRDMCVHNMVKRDDVVLGPVAVARDPREYRKSFTDVGCHPLYGNCGTDAVYFVQRL